ncbi:sigma-70 family RNA polymerase sigma factor [Tenacibaculum finnmarkense genomovar finnmarkense]|uniref:Sigma-70 family RNA polymerase sigma factor n=1 Tax=Tenacibaculum finnmarkense genomovar finnmarkense TaxID=1458503 RepID=A0AAP1RH97_9FLAO|nr:sigma-70 family RNA polymerase sigma factor [Tenacibaculum finnmarkense]MBE7653900.1 sigma-70 family RNA polymerase sigma factor [Tenacibaculum finnmarkense genomovar finnmarkense]MBE7660102.1 sigma-70 family RNA polymerase sigma factor [Tenacibaculum finnmarkense genomovar finnmarkense]MBE7692894.1 sigma-70 family RNA polymerase sigma factor [Tenacibaculum finnmarkense genomovar finnmarkense]MBE7696195.1 sigma-70 family RNA polymerase sigma factor [Tenacibaculum finnmarkense genomovar finnm
MNAIATKITDEDLVYQIVSTNNTALFGVLYNRFSRMVFYKCYGFSKNKQEAEDLMHDVFIRLFIKLKTFKGTSKFSVWLYSFTYNFCVNYVQRNNYKKNEKITVLTDKIKDQNIKDEKEGALFLELKSIRLAKAFRMIAASEKMILLMKYQDDMSIKEISNTLNIGNSAVKMRLKRAKDKISEIYKDL